VASTAGSRSLSGVVDYVRTITRTAWVSVRYAVTDHCIRRTDSTTSAVAEPGPFLVTWMTCSQDDLEHAVTDEQACLVIRTGRGIYQAICAHQIIPRALSAPPGSRCGRCEAICVEESTARGAGARQTGQRRAFVLLR
jgi:hypothetical protein